MNPPLDIYQKAAGGMLILAALAAYLGFIYCLINIIAYISGGNKLLTELKVISVIASAVMLFAIIILAICTCGASPKTTKYKFLRSLSYCLSFFIVALILGVCQKPFGILIMIKKC